MIWNFDYTQRLYPDGSKFSLQFDCAFKELTNLIVLIYQAYRSAKKQSSLTYKGSFDKLMSKSGLCYTNDIAHLGAKLCIYNEIVKEVIWNEETDEITLNFFDEETYYALQQQKFLTNKCIRKRCNEIFDKHAQFIN